MRKNFLFAFTLLSPILLSGQTDLTLRSHFMKDSTRNVLVRASGNYFFASDAITNAFAADYYRGIFLTEERKNEVSGNLSSENVFAGEANWEVSLTFHPDTGNRKVEAFIAFRNRAYAGSRFSRDFFELFFRGNKMFAGKTADLSDFSFQQYAYRQFVFGIANEFSPAPGQKLYVGADIAINHGIKFLNASTQSSTLYTDPIGEYIEADLHATILTDDSASQHPSRLDGTGYSGDVYLEYETENSRIDFSVENFGSIHWNKWSTDVQLDSTFIFDGIDVHDIFEIGDSIKITDAELDSVFYLNYVQNKRERRITTKLPMKISGAYTRSIIPEQLSATIGIDVLLNTNASMRYYAAFDYRLNRSNRIGIILATGGYTTLHGGLNFMHLFPWHLKLEIGSSYLYPMVSFKTSTSQGAYLSLSKSF